MSDEEKDKPEDEDKTAIYFNLAIEAWCEQFKPALDTDQADKVTMADILDALDSYYGTKDLFIGTSVFIALKNRGYVTTFDAVSNQFKILVSQ